MSFYFEAAGSKKRMQELVLAFEPYGDKSQWLHVRDMIMLELDAWRSDAPIYLKVSGHHDDRRNLSVEFRPGPSL